MYRGRKKLDWPPIKDDFLFYVSLLTKTNILLLGSVNRITIFSKS